MSAIGYLVNKSGGQELAEKINSEFYSSADPAHNSVLSAWRSRHGLTREELAIIQPAFN
jgi:hypothetical protein